MGAFAAAAGGVLVSMSQSVTSEPRFSPQLLQIETLVKGAARLSKSVTSGPSFVL